MSFLKSIPPKIDVPVTVVAGHFDHHMEGTLLGYELLSEPLDEPLMISGPLTAKVWFSSDCEDTAVTVKVSEERADGTTYNIRTGIATLAYRDDKLGSRQTYIPGEIVEVTVEMLPIVWSHQTKTRVANQKVHIGKKHPTRVILPILWHQLSPNKKAASVMGDCI